MTSLPASVSPAGRGAPDGMGPEPGTVLQVAASLGYVRDTNYGRLFDVRVETSPANLAFTSLPIPPHTDNPYRDPVPTVSCRPACTTRPTAASPVSWTGSTRPPRSASRTRPRSPRSPSPRSHPPTATRPRSCPPPGRIRLDPHGRIREIRVNSRSLQPVRLPGARTAAFCAAYGAFAELLSSPAAILTVRLGPGDCAVFDNTRVLHSRTGFASAGRRHLQGCYADLDGIELAVAAGERARKGDTRRKDRT